MNGRHIVHHFNRDELEQRVGQDSELLSELLGYAIEDFPMYIQSLQEAVAAGDTVLYSKAAHKMKGFARNMAFPALGDLCQTAELNAAIDLEQLKNIDKEVQILIEIIENEQKSSKGARE